MKIIILVLSLNDGDLYTEFYNTQKKTWDSIEVDGIDTFYYFGNCEDNEIVDNNIYTNVSETLLNCTDKTLEAFKLINNMDYDYVFRTNSSSYVDKHRLKEYLNNKPKTNFYSGIIGLHEHNYFCSGSGFFLSKDLITLLINNEDKLDRNLIDDVSIGKLLNSFNIPLVNSERFDVVSSDDISNNFFHYRLKTLDRNDDIKNMIQIFNNKCN
jgi:hypothetical protein